MKLPDLVLPSRANQTWQYSGMDSPDLCATPQHFESYPHAVTYQYNSRGFRDCEWPDDLDDAVWCIGDSFTVGLGLPQQHTWPYQLGKKLKRPALNISMDGASNQWIARRTREIISELEPDLIIVQWSYLHRREATVEQVQLQQLLELYNNIRDSTWSEIHSVEEFRALPETIQAEVNLTPCHSDHLQFWFEVSDEARRLHHVNTTPQQDIDTTIECIRHVHQPFTRIIHTFVPGFGTLDPVLNQEFFSRLDDLSIEYLPEIDPQDLARDGHHYGIATVDCLTDQLVEMI